MEQIAVCNASDDPTVVAYINLSEFPAAVQDLANRGEVWGAYLLPDGRVIVEETGGVLHETAMKLDAFYRLVRL